MVRTISLLIALGVAAASGQGLSLLDYVQQGEQLAKAGRLEEAIAAYEKAEKAGAGSAQFLNRMGELYLLGGKFDQGIARFRRSLGEQPQQGRVFISLGEAFLAAGKLDSSIAYLEKARHLAPQSSKVHSSLGFVYLQSKAQEQAYTFLRQALELDQSNADAHRFIGLYYAQKDSLDRALDAYRQVVKLMPQDVEAHNNIAYILSAQGKFPAALAAYQKTKELVQDPRLLLALEDNIASIRALMEGKMRARLILVGTVEQAQSLLGRLEKGEDFGQLAAEFSQFNRAQGGDVGFFSPGDLQAEFERQVLQLEVGQTSGVVQIPMGIMIIQRLN